MKTHLLVVQEPIARNCWPESIEALCHAEIKAPRPVVTVDVEIGALEATSTVLICDKCRLALLSTRLTELRWIYGVMCGQDAHQANLRLRTED